MRAAFCLPLLLTCAFFAAGCGSTPDQPVRSVTIREIKPRPIETARFKRVSEYFTGAEHSGDRLILRSSPEVRTGYYFVLILDTPVRKLPEGAVIKGEFHGPGMKGAETHEFTLPSERPKTREIFVGLTGADWPSQEAVPAAWRFTISDADGNRLARARSYLWSL